MSDPIPIRTPASSLSRQDAAPSSSVVLDGRYPDVPDHRGKVLQVTAGHVDLFAVRASDGRDGGRQHLFRVESGDAIFDLPQVVDDRDARVRVIAVGGPGAQAILLPRHEIASPELVSAWLARLASVMAGPNPSWQMREAPSAGTAELDAGERRRGPVRNVAWLSVHAGSAKLMGLAPPYQAGDPPLPLTSGTWVEAGADCTISGSLQMPTGGMLWRAVDQFHIIAIACIRDRLIAEVDRELERLGRRSELIRTQGSELLDRLSGIVMPRRDHAPAEADPDDPLLAACRIVGEAIHTPVMRPSGRTSGTRDFFDIIEIARASRLRVRRNLLRGNWWTKDVGPLVGWHGEGHDPVALVRRTRRSYVMIDPRSHTVRTLDRCLSAQLSPEAASFYPALPARPLGFRDLLTFSIGHARGNLARIVVAVAVLGLCSLLPPLITQVLVNSIIPRSELDQLGFCVLALVVTALAITGMQTMQGFAMIRLEGLIDWKLQAAMIDRVLRLPVPLFREFTVGDLVDRALGIDHMRRIFTGRTLRSLLAAVTALFSVGLMLFYDLKLALIALALTAFRAALILAMSALRLYHESRHFNLQGRIGGFVLQLLAGIGKLRVAAATVRALAIWSNQFAAQKRHFVASQQAANALAVFETSFAPIATLIIFVSATAMDSTLLSNLGAFLGFFAAFGQSMAAIGLWAAGVGDSLVAIPHLTRMRPLIDAAAEMSDDRKPPGELSGAVELSRVTFRYVAGGPPVLDNVSLRVGPGEYVAIVGPSGSGKSSLFRLLLGFERAESGAVFFDGKSIETLDISAVRRQLGVVLQNGKLVTGSLYDNICGGVRLPLEHAWEAARLAGIDADIKAMPMGMHTAIAEGVNTLSGGQRQRIMIARAIARRPRILLFDEATSSLDNQSQAIVSASLGELNVTRIVIAHRLSTVREADRIVVLVDGKIVQDGPFAELNAVPGMFADFARRQLLE
jgi:NHLM bacteriocin system ABC transporter ATP-binding protein